MQHLKGGSWAHAGAEVTRAFLAGSGDKGRGAKFLNEIHVVKASIRLGEGWEFARTLPVEAAAVNHQATNHDAMPAQKLSGRMKNNIGTQIEWPAQVRRGESGVDHQWQAVTVGDLSYCWYVEYFKARVAQRFAEQQPGIGLDSRSESLRLARVDEGGLDAKARQRVFEQVVGATIERA